MFPDVPPAIRRWRDGRPATSRSTRRAASSRSGGCSSRREHGDLTPLYHGVLRHGASARKSTPASYARIAAALDVPPAEILFVSDVTRELDAAREAGCQVVLSLRPGNPPQPDADSSSES